MAYIAFPRERERAYELHRQNGLAEEGLERQRRLAGIVDNLVRAYRDLAEVGADKAFLYDALRGLHDEVSNIEHGCEADMDEAGLGGEPVDMAELDALIEKVRP